ncbi:RNA polymerase sigma-70 factor, ECF subfamily [bacterium A37T11]|nr:RNA polymerase sigma-70 factor, ECF subfamily [bacterium A37T11]
MHFSFFIDTFTIHISTVTMIHISTHDEKFFLQRLQQGDEQAFTAIYQQFGLLLYAYAYKLCGKEDDAKDIVQDIFTFLWNARQTMEIPSSLRAYLFSAVRYKFLNLVAHEKVKDDYAEQFRKYVTQRNGDADDALLLKDLINQVEKVAATLPGKMGKVFTMSYLEHYTHLEIAEALEISEKTVKNLLSEATKAVRSTPGLAILLAFIFLQ